MPAPGGEGWGEPAPAGDASPGGGGGAGGGACSPVCILLTGLALKAYWGCFLNEYPAVGNARRDVGRSSCWVHDFCNSFVFGQPGLAAFFVWPGPAVFVLLHFSVFFSEYGLATISRRQWRQGGGGGG